MRLEKMKLSSIVIRLKVMVADSFRLLIGILLFLLLFFLGSQSAFAATLQNAHITADTVWVASSSPYIVTENIEIKPEVTLTIEPGVVVKVDVSRSIVVHGILRAVGTEYEPISFTSTKDDSVGGDSDNNGTATKPVAGDWQGIRFTPASSGYFEYVAIRYAGYANRSVGGYPSIYNESGKVSVNESIIANSAVCAYAQTNGKGSIQNTSISDAFCGVAYFGGEFDFSNNTIRNTNRAAFFNGTGTVSLTGNIFDSNYLAADVSMRKDFVFTHSGNTASGGQYNGLIVRGFVIGNQILTVDDMPYIIVSNGGSLSIGVLRFITENNLTIQPGATLALEPAVVVKFDSGGGLFVHGSINAVGTQLKPIIFTSIKDDSVAGDTNGDNKGTLPNRGDWLHVRFYDNSQGYLEHVKVTYGGTTKSIVGSGANIYNNGGEVMISYAEIAYGGMQGVSHDRAIGFTTIGNSNIHGNPIQGVKNSTQIQLDARNNYWGDASGPFHWQLNPNGQGDEVSANVLFEPWKKNYCTENCYSNVLFLPGIKGSRLYNADDDKIWEPLLNYHVDQMGMTQTGESINDIYTSDIVSKAHGFVDIYDGFGRFMNRISDPDQDDLIADWTPFAYDWRYSVKDVVYNGTQYKDEVRDIADEVEFLAGSSRTGKVTIIAHSNGGLVAKMLIERLEQEGRNDLVDRVVFLASPQLGTPAAIGSILHGYDEEVFGGWVVNDENAREVIRNMPGAYGLLPSQSYFDEVSGPKILFDSSESTAAFRAAYGTSIDSRDELNAFMSGEADGRADAVGVEEAIRANAQMLEASSQFNETILDDWVAPDTIEVVEVVGVGLDTVSGFRYTEFTERVCTLGIFSCEVKSFYKPIPLISQYGDKVVIANSAEAYEEEKQTFYLDLRESVIKGGSFAVTHGEFSNSPSIQELISNILTEENSEIEFISETEPGYSESRILLGVHSPVTLRVTDTQGRQVGVQYIENLPMSQEEVPGSSYFEFANSKYVTLPAGSAYAIEVKGTGEGGLTFTLDELWGEEQSNVVTVEVPIITPSTSISMYYKDEVLSSLFVDEDGDGETDYELTKEGVRLDMYSTYSDLRTSIENLHLHNKWSKPLLALVHTSEVFTTSPARSGEMKKLKLRSLERLEEDLRMYVSEGILSSAQISPIIRIINNLE